MRFNRRLAIVVALVVCAWTTAQADRGGIPFKRHVTIYEPNQRAVVAWNGTEELLLLSTNLYASEPTKVLEVLPLPSEPKVQKGDLQVFVGLTNLINEKLRPKPSRHGAGSGRAGGKSFGGSPPPPAGEVTFHEKIGAHDVSVAKVLNNEGFVEWVEKYLKSAGEANPNIPEPMKQMVGEYLNEGFSWFVFDVVELQSTVRTTDAIEYRFKSDSLYYPLKISSTGDGKSQIDLMVLSRSKMRIESVSGLWRQLHRVLTATHSEVIPISTAIAALFAGEPEIMLRQWRIEGLLHAFDKDLKAVPKPPRPRVHEEW